MQALSLVPVRAKAHLNAKLRHQIFDITMTKVETLVEPYGVLNDFRRDL